MYFIVYKTTNKINGKYYIGVHKTKTLNDDYLGSGKALKQAITKYGSHNFERQILFVYDNPEEMYEKEKQLVTLSEMSYNLCEGGKGGFSFINNSGINLGANNVMNRCPEVKQKVIQKMTETKRKNPEKYSSIAKANFSKAAVLNTGKKRPEHSKLMKDRGFFREMWNEENKQKTRDLFSSFFEVISPTGNIFVTNRLEEFCVENNLTYTSLWNTSITNTPVKKGRTKGWICKKI